MATTGAIITIGPEFTRLKIGLIKNLSIPAPSNAPLITAQIKPIQYEPLLVTASYPI